MNNSVQGHIFVDRAQDRKFYPTARINFKDRLALGIQDQSNRFPNLHALQMPQLGDQLIQEYVRVPVMQNQSLNRTFK